MKIANYLRTRVAHVTVASLAAGLAALALVVVAAPSALAATNPALGSAGTFGVLSSTFTNGGATTINGDLGFTTPSVVPATVNGVTYHPPTAQTGIDQSSALAALNSYAGTCLSLPNTDLSLAPDHSPGQPNGTYVPGVYCTPGAASTGTGITLVGGGTYIFLVNGALNTVANQPGVTLSGGASACDVWWAPIGGTTLGAQTTLGATPNFIGTDIDPAGITVGANENWSGRALDFQTTVTTNNDTISVPACSSSTPAPVQSSPTTCTITASPNPATVGQSITFTATVTGMNPTGTVIFSVNSSTVGSSSLNSSSQATYTTTNLALGSNVLVASYAGDGSNRACQSAPLTEGINQVVTSTTVVSPTPTTTPFVVTPTTEPVAPKRPTPTTTPTSSPPTPIAPPSPIITTLVPVTG
jgi:type VI secretion system secreted protein VgrG